MANFVQLRRVIAAVLVLLVVFSIASAIDFMSGGFYRMPSLWPPI